MLALEAASRALTARSTADSCKSLPDDACCPLAKEQDEAEARAGRAAAEATVSASEVLSMALDSARLRLVAANLMCSTNATIASGAIPGAGVAASPVATGGDNTSSAAWPTLGGGCKVRPSWRLWLEGHANCWAQWLAMMMALFFSCIWRMRFFVCRPSVRSSWMRLARTMASSSARLARLDSRSRGARPSDRPAASRSVLTAFPALPAGGSARETQTSATPTRPSATSASSGISANRAVTVWRSAGAFSFACTEEAEMPKGGKTVATTTPGPSGSSSSTCSGWILLPAAAAMTPCRRSRSRGSSSGRSSKRRQSSASSLSAKRTASRKGICPGLDSPNDGLC
mmetsp:Transcript_108908/g.325732  ORF Transcript_108908/g.325732 Transcript_108908/m.325732 type:complete len:343 (-) Transcript_108908:425-1453(-)